MDYKEIAEIIENEIDNFRDSFRGSEETIPPREYFVLNNEMLELNKNILDKIADLFPEKKYKIINNNDGNDEIKLEHTNENEALHEALDKLGWTLFV